MGTLPHQKRGVGNGDIWCAPAHPGEKISRASTRTRYVCIDQMLRVYLEKCEVRGAGVTYPYVNHTPCLCIYVSGSAVSGKF